MAIDLYNRLVDNDLSREDLLENIIVCNVNRNDIAKIIEILSKSFGMGGEYEAFFQIVNSNMDLDNSVKAIDKRDGKIYGLLMFAHYDVADGSPLRMLNPTFCTYLSQYSQINGHSFIIDERLRGTGLDKKMLYYNTDFLKSGDFIWCGVEKSLRTLSYWHKLGFVEMCKIPDATFLILPLNEDIKFDLRYYI